MVKLRGLSGLPCPTSAVFCTLLRPFWNLFRKLLCLVKAVGFNFCVRAVQLCRDCCRSVQTGWDRRQACRQQQALTCWPRASSWSVTVIAATCRRKPKGPTPVFSEAVISPKSYCSLRSLLPGPELEAARRGLQPIPQRQVPEDD